MNGPPSGPGIVTFDAPQWFVEYPEFATSVTLTQAQTYFNRATLYCDNTPQSQIQDIWTRTVLLNMVTAHIAKLFAMLGGQAPQALVGRIGNAAEGTVNVATVYVNPTSDLQAWFAQTSYGAAFWAATTQYRTGFYMPGPNNWPFPGPAPGLPGGFAGNCPPFGTPQ